MKIAAQFISTLLIALSTNYGVAGTNPYDGQFSPQLKLVLDCSELKMFYIGRETKEEPIEDLGVDVANGDFLVQDSNGIYVAQAWLREAGYQYMVFSSKGYSLALYPNTLDGVKPFAEIIPDAGGSRTISCH